MVFFTSLIPLLERLTSSLFRPIFNHCNLINNDYLLFSSIPVVDLSNPNAKTLLVEALEEYGFFKVINHGVPMEMMTKLDYQANNFFSLDQSEKEKAAPTSDQFGYGNRKIGPNGDVGWVEYLLLSTDPDVVSDKLLDILKENPDFIRSTVKDYIAAVKKLAIEVLELLADGLSIQPRSVFSKFLKDEASDSVFRLNHYPPCPPGLQALGVEKLVGFGEHTDPQIISVLRSNNISGFQIALNDGSWVSVPPDENSFYINVGDSLQVMTNGRFRSVKHRVMANGLKSRISNIFFGGPPVNELIAPLASLLAEGEESMYNGFTWSEYKKSAYKSRLADNRLGHFEKQKLTSPPSPSSSSSSHADDDDDDDDDVSV